MSRDSKMRQERTFCIHPNQNSKGVNVVYLTYFKKETFRFLLQLRWRQNYLVERNDNLNTSFIYHPLRKKIQIIKRHLKIIIFNFLHTHYRNN